MGVEDWLDPIWHVLWTSEALLTLSRTVEDSRGERLVEDEGDKAEAPLGGHARASTW